MEVQFKGGLIIDQETPLAIENEPSIGGEGPCAEHILERELIIALSPEELQPREPEHREDDHSTGDERETEQFLLLSPVIWRGDKVHRRDPSF